jgi:GNAT superfamily N-acetyltransferase
MLHQTLPPPRASYTCIPQTLAPPAALSAIREPATYEIRSVVVLEQHRRRGVGTAVVQALLQQAGESAAVYLTTVEGPNVVFYGRLGLQEVPTPAFLVAEQLAGSVVTQLLFSKRCLVLGRPGRGGRQ